MEPQPRVEDSASPSSLSPFAVATAAIDANLMNLTQSLSDFLSEFQSAKSEEARLKDEVKEKSREIYLLRERVKFESFDKRMIEEELKEESEKWKEKEETYQKLTKDLENQNREMRDELKTKEERYQKSTEDLENQNREMRDELKTKEDRYQKSTKDLENQNRKMRDELKMKEERYQKSMEDLENQNCEMRDELKTKEERYQKSTEDLENQNREMRDELKTKEQRYRKSMEDLEAQIRKLRYVLKAKIRESREDEEIWKTRFLGLEKRVSILEDDINLIEVLKYVDGDNSGGNSDENGSRCRRIIDHVNISHAASTPEPFSIMENGQDLHLPVQEQLVASNAAISNVQNSQEQSAPMAAISQSIKNVQNVFAPQTFNHPIPIKLEETNFLSWHHEVIATVKGYKLQKYLMGFHFIPPKFLTEEDELNGVLNEDFLNWKQQDSLLLSWLLSSMSQAMRNRVIGCEFSHEVWEKLQTHFSSQTRAKITQYRTQLRKTKQGSLTLDGFLLEIRKLVNVLASVGEPVTQNEHIESIFDGLNDEYESFIASMMARIEPYTVEEFESLLKAQEKRFNKKRKAIVESDKISANLAQTCHQHKDKKYVQNQNFSQSDRQQNFSSRTQI